MRTIITGSSGFCGRHLCRLLEREGVEVFTLSPREGGPKHLQIKSIHDLNGMVQTFRRVQPDFVFHLAGIVTAHDTRQIYQVNAEYALTLLEAMESVKLPDTPVLVVGTAAEYGMVEERDLPVTEVHCCRPVTHYGISKLAQTGIGLLAARQGQPVIVARPANIFGPGMPEHLVISSIAAQVAQVLQGKRPPVIEMGNTQTYRDFIGVEETVQIYWKLAQTPAAYGQVVNVCCGQPIAIHALVLKMLEIAGCQAQVVSLEKWFKKDDQPVFYGSPKKLEQLIGPCPSPQIEDTLRSIVDEYLN